MNNQNNQNIELQQYGSINVAGIRQEFPNDPVVLYLLDCLENKPQYDIAEVLQNMHDSTVIYSSIVLDKLSTQPDDSLPELNLLMIWSNILQVIEYGMLDMTDDGKIKKANMTCALFVLESLARKGLVIFHRKNASLFYDLGNLAEIPPEVKL